MTPNGDAYRLLAEYAAGNLTEEQRAELTRAALEDPEIFEAMVEEEKLREALEDSVFPRRVKERLRELGAENEPYWTRLWHLITSPRGMLTTAGAADGYAGCGVSAIRSVSVDARVDPGEFGSVQRTGGHSIEFGGFTGRCRARDAERASRGAETGDRFARSVATGPGRPAAFVWNWRPAADWVSIRARRQRGVVRRAARWHKLSIVSESLLKSRRR